MIRLFIAGLLLPLTHFGISSSALRADLVRRLGEQPYRGLYSLVALAAFAWLVAAYRGAPMVPLWPTPPFVVWAALPVVFLAFLLAVIGLTTPNPTIVGAERLFARPNVTRGILRVSRNPFLWGVGLWALAHLAVTGDLASLLLFGSIGSLGLVGAPLLDAKKARQHGRQWELFAAETSSLPFLAILQRRQRLALNEIGPWRVAAAVALFGFALLAHRWAFGVSPLSLL
jgi:uncharacterized membrane protein